ncbi:multifunctional CCA addition/repair protein [Candidatus Erwinia haradaeae]|uniref:CCA-adding enzyme n=1 Tax=Candidatus Erwinia haradaeae TaxID=1922217 RepID=A0A451DLU7_9GAMM|nr:multifunctional CCA addition/repair protein [Candidatus Erwinia haradaeae]VFP87718.1 Multifunctional CCA protein [Candidatus Erwinia haradaeae]
MEIYLVGGAIRDELLDLPVKDKDWVVVGGSPKQMLQLGYKKVGRHFPVFLHPISREEYALARTEKKSGKGYIGFVCYSKPDVTLKEDLARRDLTINAIAKDKYGVYYDPYGGRIDLQKRKLRHISSAFCEDPLRVLRIARFSAYFANLQFRIAQKTWNLMKKVVDSGELSSLSRERIWREMDLALKTHHPQVFLQVLKDCGALNKLFPELNLVYCSFFFKKTQGPLITTNKKNIFLTLSTVAKHCLEVDVRFAALCYDLKKSIITQDNISNNGKADKIGTRIISIFCNSLQIPKKYRDLALLVSEFYGVLHTIHLSSPEELITLFNRIDAWRKPYRVEKIAYIIDADSSKCKTCSENFSSKGEYFYHTWKIVQSVSTQEIISAGFIGQKVREELCRRRISALTIRQNSQ